MINAHDSWHRLRNAWDSIENAVGFKWESAFGICGQMLCKELRAFVRQ